MNYNKIKAYLCKNKGKCLKYAALSVVIIVSLGIYLTEHLTEKTEIALIENEAAQITEITKEPIPVSEEKEKIIVVDIAGAVKNPGVVYLIEGSRVNDAVTEAGGLAENADTILVNLAAKLSDGDKVYIPEEKKNEKSASSEPAGIITNIISNSADSSNSSGASGSGSSLININTADSEQLQALSGVGPATAQKIIDYRNKSGGFKKIEDIMKVSGIGAKTYEKLKDKITI